MLRAIIEGDTVAVRDKTSRKVISAWMKNYRKQ